MRKYLQSSSLITRKSNFFLSALLCCLFLVAQAASPASAALSQQRITVKVKNATLDETLQKIGSASGHYMLYKVSDIAHVQNINIDEKDISVEDALNKSLENSGLTYESNDNTIVVYKEDSPQSKPEVERRTLQGVVFDENGRPLSGATVMVGEKGVMTDGAGRFVMQDVAVGSKVSIRFMGMETVKTTFSGAATMDITLRDDVTAVGDVIITGFGTIKKEAYAGAASMVKLDDMADVPVGNITDLLVGTAPGVQMSSPGGGPGGVNTIRIRGIGSISASSAPLIVLDGIPIRSGSVGATSSSNTSNFDIMSTINPNDIESMTVIKDAAAASLYGSRAANGVILIVTKSGKKGDAKINFKQDIGFSDFSIKYRPYLRGQERYDFIYDGMRRAILHTDYELKKYPDRSEAGATKFADSQIDKIVVQRDENGNPIWTDWKDALFRKGRTLNTELSISGATDKLSYFSSLGYSQQQGITRIQELERYSGRLNVEYKARKTVTVGAKISLSSTNQDYGFDNMAYNSPIYSVYHKITDSDPIYNEDGTHNRTLLSNKRYNPHASQTYDIRKRQVKRFSASIYAQWQILPYLSARSTLSYDYTGLVESDFDHPLGSDWTADGSTQGSASKYFRNTGDMVSSTNMNYVKKFGDHTLDALVAYEVSRFDRDRLSGQRKNFLDPDMHGLSNGGELSSVSGFGDGYRMVSVISRVNYDFRDKLYFGASYRTDGSSRFTYGERWGHFWSVSGAWRFTAEPFMEGTRNILNDGKLRVSYGINGNLPSGYYDGYQVLDLGRYNELNTMLLNSLVSPDFRWEKNAVLNIGLDLSFINRINLAVDFYDRKTTDLILNVPVSMTSGFSSKKTNIGKVLNRGFEFEIFTRNIIKKDFTWNTTLNFSTNYNEVLRLDGDVSEMSVAGNNLARIGKPYYNYNLVEFAGIDPANGNGVFYLNKLDADGNMPSKKDLYNADGSLNTLVGTYKRSEAEEILTGKSALPSFTGGISNSLRWKWFDLNFLFTFTLGGWSHDSAMQKSRTAGGSDAYVNQIPTVYRDSWKKPGDIAGVERWSYGNSNTEMTGSSTARLHSTDHLRLKNLSFGVTLPKEWTRKVKLDKVRLYVSGTNLLTWAANNMYDPETPVDGSVQYETPQLKTITFGIDLTF